MRMSKQTRELMAKQLRKMFDKYGESKLRQTYIDGDFLLADRVKDLDTRFRWDSFWMAAYLDEDGAKLIEISYDYPDAQIETALRRLIAPL